MAAARAHHGITVLDLINAGILNAGDEATCEPRKGEQYRGSIGPQGELVFNGVSYRAPSGAGGALAGRSSDGWKDIKVNGRPLAEYRNRLGDRSAPTTHPTPLPAVPAPSPAVLPTNFSPPTTTPTSLLSLVQDHIRDIKEKVASKIQNLSPGNFEELLAEVLSAIGYTDVRRTGGSGDGNIDVIGKYRPPFTSVALRVQVKHRRNGPNIGPTDVAAFRDRAGGADHVLLMVTNVDFTGGAIETASEQGRQIVHLLKGDELVDAMVDKRVGVKDGLIGMPEVDHGFWTKFESA